MILIAGALAACSVRAPADDAPEGPSTSELEGGSGQATLAATEAADQDDSDQGGGGGAGIAPTATLALDYGECGMVLPILPTQPEPLVVGRPRDVDLSPVPAGARPAVERILEAPLTVSLTAFEMGSEAQGVRVNPTAQVPLASVVKIVHLIAYAEAVTNGEVNPETRVLLDDLNLYYLPGTDQGAHPRAIADLRNRGGISGDPATLALEDIPWMMMRYSSNAATDYIHMLLGQRRIEQTARDLGFTMQTAPCPFLGQYLAIGNHERSIDNLEAIDSYLQDPLFYAQDVMRLTALYTQLDSFREAEIDWRDGASERERRDAWIAFTEDINAQGASAEYARLMADIAAGGPISPTVNQIVRRYLEWPLVAYPGYDEAYLALGHKSGSLPGTLTGIYYGTEVPDEETGERRPTVVVAAFFHGLPFDTYRDWLRTVPYDDLAFWLIDDPAAIDELRVILGGG
ncbi:MAG: serine hydrolase [Chloroflexi bacterium]|nr:serine hydrolase [Chloroflexota bacterium]